MVRRAEFRALVLGSLVAVLVAAVGCAPASQSGLNAQDEDALRGLVGELMECYNTSDARRYVRVFTEDAIRMPPDAPILIGSDRIRDNIIANFETYDLEVTFTVDEVRARGDLAYMRGSWARRRTPKMGGAAEAAIGKWLFVLEEIDGEWKISRSIWNNDSPAAPIPS